MKDLKDKNVLIIGDIGIDHYMIGEATRLSPEAPVPVLNNIHEEFRLGLAANVAHNVKALGSTPTVISVSGTENRGCSALLSMAKIRHFIAVDHLRKTTMKTRVMAGQTQLVRIDEETTDPISSISEFEIISFIEYEMRKTDIVIIQDYGKGVITRRVMTKVMELSERYGLKVLVDPYSKQDISIYFGADTLTPNKQECLELSSKFKVGQDIKRATTLLAQSLNLNNVLTTLGKDGMYGYSRSTKDFNIKSKASSTVDVTGAGDTVIATLAIGLASGLDFKNAADMANHAAGIVVKKLGTSVCTKEELLKSLKERFK